MGENRRMRVDREGGATRCVCSCCAGPSNSFLSLVSPLSRLIGMNLLFSEQLVLQYQLFTLNSSSSSNRQ